MKGYEQLVNQYELMQVIFQRAESKIREINYLSIETDYRHSDLEELFFVILEEALIENGDQYLMFKEKKPERQQT